MTNTNAKNTLVLVNVLMCNKAIFCHGVLILCKITVADPCEPGSYSSSGLAPCTLCPLHHYQEHPASTVCVECQPEKLTEMVGANNSSMCIGK